MVLARHLCPRRPGPQRPHSALPGRRLQVRPRAHCVQRRRLTRLLPDDHGVVTRGPCRRRRSATDARRSRSRTNATAAHSQHSARSRDRAGRICCGGGGGGRRLHRLRIQQLSATAFGRGRACRIRYGGGGVGRRHSTQAAPLCHGRGRRIRFGDGLVGRWHPPRRHKCGPLRGQYSDALGLVDVYRPRRRSQPDRAHVGPHPRQPRRKRRSTEDRYSSPLLR